MRFGRIGLTRPENIPKSFNVYTKESSVTSIGRVTKGGMVLRCTARCILSEATPEERERYNQMSVTVTHSILQRGKPLAKEQDVLARVRDGREVRWFRVQAVHNKGDMDIDTIYLCEERSDLK